MAWWRRARTIAAGAASGVDEAVRDALRQVLEDDLEAAEEALSRVVRTDSDQVEVYLLLARLYRRRGETGRAIRIHQNLLLRKDLADDLRHRALLGLAGDFRQGGFLQRAIAAYEEVLDREPRNVEALRALVRLHADARTFPRALELRRRLSKALGEDGRTDEARLLVESAAAAHAEGRNDDARRALRRALRRDPAFAQAWIALGSLEAERGRTKRALAAWSRVPKLDRRAAATVYARLESAYAALGRPRDFDAAMRKLLTEQPDDDAVRVALARALAARGEIEEALGELDTVLDLRPDALPAQLVRGRILLGEGRESEAAKVLGELIDLLERRGARERAEPIA